MTEGFAVTPTGTDAAPLLLEREGALAEPDAARELAAFELVERGALLRRSGRRHDVTDALRAGMKLADRWRP